MLPTKFHFLWLRGFQRRRLKCEKLTDDRRRMPSNGKSSHCLWQCELKMYWIIKIRSPHSLSFSLSRCKPRKVINNLKWSHQCVSNSKTRGNFQLVMQRLHIVTQHFSLFDAWISHRLNSIISVDSFYEFDM